MAFQPGFLLREDFWVEGFLVFGPVPQDARQMDSPAFGELGIVSCLSALLDSGSLENYFPSMNYREHITIDSRVRSGKPCIRGTRITVADVFDYLGGGMTIPEVLDDFPDLTADDIQACFAFAADRDRRLNVVPHEVAL